MLQLSTIVAITIAVLIAAQVIAQSQTPSSPTKPAPAAPSALGFTMNDIDGKPVDLATYKGKVILMVNTASQCGYTPQYQELQELYKKHKDAGLVILGFPANNFGEQEPGTNDEIKGFCTKTYGVTFPMFAKVSVKGDDQCPLYKFLTSSDSNPKFAGDIKWNFEKFLIGRDGQVVNRFNSKVKPSGEELTKAVEAELAKK